MWKKIVNPETGRKVSIYGKIGQQILRNYISLQRGNGGKKYEIVNFKPTYVVNCKDFDSWDWISVPQDMVVDRRNCGNIHFLAIT